MAKLTTEQWAFVTAVVSAAVRSRQIENAQALDDWTADALVLAVQVDLAKAIHDARNEAVEAAKAGAKFN